MLAVALSLCLLISRQTCVTTSGERRVACNPHAPLDEEAQGFMQSRVDDYYGAFTKAIARGRGVPIAQVRDGMCQGRVLPPVSD